MPAKRPERPSGEVQKILQEAKDRFKRASDWEATSRARFRDDVKFAEGDAYNNYQWGDLITQRSIDKRPSLTINRVRQHNLDILNDARQSRVAVKVRPLRDGASYESSQILDGVIKHIEYISHADAAYQMALRYAVQGGIGWVRLVTDYAGDDTFDQEIFIRPVPDPLSVLLDPDIKQFDGSDARFGFVFTDMPKDEFDRAYPKFKDTATNNEIAPDMSWGSISGGEKVRVAEYFRCVPQDDALVAYINPDTRQQEIKRKSQIDKEMLDRVIDDPETEQRQVVLTKVEHFKIIGDQLAEDNIWPGKYVPLLRCVGEETIIDGILDRKGHTRALLDSQRMYNYSASAAVEYGALQTKSPWVVGLESIEETQSDWENANTENKAFLGYKKFNDDGTENSPPQRPQPPSGAPVFMQGMRDALEQMYLASGQNQADFGMPSNEKSGVAIEKRQRQGDNATYHYLDHQADMIRLLGIMLLDLIRAVYDTERMVQWRDEAGNEGKVSMNPDAPQHFAQEKDADGNVTAVMNPKMGVYDVQADVGPAYATRRQEAFAAFSQLLGANKELFALVGDIWMRFADIPGGEEAAERLKRMVPQQALEDGPAPDLVAAQQQIGELKQLLAQTAAKLEDKQAKNVWEEQKQAVGAYRATTERLAAIKDVWAHDPIGLMVVLKEVMEEAQAQSAGGNAVDHAIDAQSVEQEHLPASVGGLSPGPEPHPPPLDPNKIPAVAEPSEA